MRDIQKYEAKPVAAFNQYLPRGPAASPRVPVPLRKRKGARAPQAFRQSWTDSRSADAPPMGDRSRSMIDVRGGAAADDVDDDDDDEEEEVEELSRNMAQQKQQYDQLKQMRQDVQESDQAWQSSLAEWKSRRIGASEKLLHKLNEHAVGSNGDVRLYRSPSDDGGDDGRHGDGGDDGRHGDGGDDGRHGDGGSRGGGRGGFYGNNGFDEDDDDVDFSSASRGSTSSAFRAEAPRGRVEVPDTRRDAVGTRFAQRDAVDARETRRDAVDTRETRRDAVDTRDARREVVDSRETRRDAVETREARRDVVDTRDTSREVVTTLSQASSTLPRTSTVSRAYAEAPKPSPSPSVPAQPRSTETQPSFNASQAPRKAPARPWDNAQTLPRGFKAEASTSSFSRPPDKPSEAHPESVKSYNRTVQGWKAREAQSFKAEPSGAKPAAKTAAVTKTATANANTYSTGYGTSYNTAPTAPRIYGAARAEDESGEGWRRRVPAVSPPAPPVRQAAPPAKRVATPPAPPPRKPDSSGLAVNRLSQRAPLPASLPPADTTLVSPGAAAKGASVTVTLTTSSPPPSVTRQGFFVSESRSFATDNLVRAAPPAQPAAGIKASVPATTHSAVATINRDSSGSKTHQWRNAEFFGFSEDSDDVMVDLAAEQKQRDEAAEEERRWLERRRLEGAVSWSASGRPALNGGLNGTGGGGGGGGGGQNGTAVGGAHSEDDDAEDEERIKREIEEEERRWNERKRLERSLSSGSPSKPGPCSPAASGGTAQRSTSTWLSSNMTTESRSASLPRTSTSTSAKYNPYSSLARGTMTLPSHHSGGNYSYRDASQRPSSYRTSSSSSQGRQTLSPNYRNFSSNSAGSGSGYGGSGHRAATSRFSTGSPSYSATYSVNYGTNRSPGYGGRSPSYGTASSGYGTASSGYGTASSGYGVRSPTYGTGSARSPSYGSPSYSGGFGAGSALSAGALALAGYGGTAYSPAKISGDKKECGSCGNAIGNGAAMFIDSLNLFFHIDCFKCEVCSSSLGDARTGMDVRMLSGQLHCSSCYFGKRGPVPVSDL